MWNVAWTGDRRPYWFSGGVTQWTPPLSARDTIFVRHGEGFSPIGNVPVDVALEKWGLFAGKMGLKAITAKEAEKGIGKVVESRLGEVETTRIASWWRDGRLLVNCVAEEESEEVLEEIEGWEGAKWGPFQFWRRMGNVVGDQKHVVCVCVFGFVSSYRRPVHYAAGLLHLARAIGLFLPEFRLRVYFDASLLPEAQSIRVRSVPPGREQRVARQSEEAWALLFPELESMSHVDLVRFKVAKLQDAGWKGAHVDLTGTFARMVPMFATTDLPSWAGAPSDPDAVVYCSDADFKGNPVETAGLQLAKWFASQDPSSRPELIGGAFGGSTAPRHRPYLGLPPIMAGQVMTGARLPQEWLLQFFQDALKGKQTSVVAGRYAQALHKEVVDAKSFERRRAGEQLSVFPFGSDEAFLTSSLVPRAQTRLEEREWVFFYVPIAVARGVLKTMIQVAEEAGRARRLGEEGERDVLELYRRLAMLGGDVEAGEGIGRMGIEEVMKCGVEWEKKWWESNRLEWSAHYESYDRGVCGPLAAQVTKEFALCIDQTMHLYLSGAAWHDADALEYMVQFRRLCDEGKAVGGIRFLPVTMGQGKMQTCTDSYPPLQHLLDFLADPSNAPDPIPVPPLPWEAPLDRKRPRPPEPPQNQHPAKTPRK